MNVRDLISQLQQLDPEMPVLSLAASGYSVLSECPPPRVITAYYNAIGGWSDWCRGLQPGQTVCLVAARLEVTGISEGSEP